MNKIYYLTDDTKIPKYIGNTCRELNERLTEHKYNCKKSKKITPKIEWIKSVDYKITIHLLEECEESISLEREKFYISKFNNLKNSKVGFKKGRIISEITKIKISNANKNRILTPEWKSKISKSCKGKIVSSDTKLKISNTRKHLINIGVIKYN